MSTQSRIELLASSESWPRCSLLDDTCLVFDIGNSLGNNLHETLLRFIVNAEPGSRLTLQRERSGFSAQWTGAVDRTAKGDLNVKRLKELRKELPSTSKP